MSPVFFRLKSQQGRFDLKLSPKLPHRASHNLGRQSASTQNQFVGFCYDLAGNLLSQTAACPNPPYNPTYVYDAENRLRSVQQTATPWYTYDGNGERVMKSIGATPTRLYWKGSATDTLTETDGGGTPSADYIYFNGKRIARVDYPAGTPGVRYYFSDHLGSSSVVTDNTGVIKDESDFYPYGGELVITDSDANHYKFTGKERDSESGLDMFGARYYGSSLGRFITPDWVAGKPSAVPFADWADPQTLNLYSYVRNNPLAKADPDGHDPGDKFKTKVAAVADAVKYIRKQEGGYKWEYGTRIHKDGKSYSYNEPVTQKNPTGVDLQPLQKNDVGDVHTHNYGAGQDAYANSIELPDRLSTAQDKEKVQKMQDDPNTKVDYQSYVGAPNGDLIQFTPNPKAPDNLGDAKVVQKNVAPDPNPPQPEKKKEESK